MTLRPLERVLQVFAALLIIGGMTYFAHGAQVAHIVTDNLLLDSKGWNENGLGLMVAGSFLVLAALLMTMWVELVRIRRLLERRSQTE